VLQAGILPGSCSIYGRRQIKHIPCLLWADAARRHYHGAGPNGRYVREAFKSHNAGVFVIPDSIEAVWVIVELPGASIRHG
jgi:hypothetical protein